MKRPYIVMATIAIASLAVFAAVSLQLSSADDDDDRSFRARLTGFQEVPAISSTGVGEITMTLSRDGSSLSYTLSYSNLEGASTLFAHIHLGQRDVNGGVMVFLCGGGGKPACPVTTGTVTGTITASDVGGPASQGIAAGEFAEFLTALRAGVAYANVHTDKHPGGEIRGQVR